MREQQFQFLLSIWNEFNFLDGVPFCRVACVGNQQTIISLTPWIDRLTKRNWITPAAFSAYNESSRRLELRPTTTRYTHQGLKEQWEMKHLPEQSASFTYLDENTPQGMGAPTVSIIMTGEGVIGINLPSGDRGSRALALEALNLLSGQNPMMATEFFDSNKPGVMSGHSCTIKQISLGGKRRRYELDPIITKIPHPVENIQSKEYEF